MLPWSCPAAWDFTLAAIDMDLMEYELWCLIRWYHDNLTRHAAEALLLSNGSDGSYLLRKSNGKTTLFSLSVRYGIMNISYIIFLWACSYFEFRICFLSHYCHIFSSWHKKQSLIVVHPTLLTLLLINLHKLVGKIQFIWAPVK